MRISLEFSVQLMPFSITMLMADSANCKTVHSREWQVKYFPRDLWVQADVYHLSIRCLEILTHWCSQGNLSNYILVSLPNEIWVPQDQQMFAFWHTVFLSVAYLCILQRTYQWLEASIDEAESKDKTHYSPYLSNLAKDLSVFQEAGSEKIELDVYYRQLLPSRRLII